MTNSKNFPSQTKIYRKKLSKIFGDYHVKNQSRIQFCRTAKSLHWDLKSILWKPMTLTGEDDNMQCSSINRSPRWMSFILPHTGANKLFLQSLMHSIENASSLNNLQTEAATHSLQAMLAVCRRWCTSKCISFALFVSTAFINIYIFSCCWIAELF